VIAIRLSRLQASLAECGASLSPVNRDAYCIAHLDGAASVMDQVLSEQDTAGDPSVGCQRCQRLDATLRSQLIGGRDCAACTPFDEATRAPVACRAP
jgi:hypothetical protein